MIRESLGLGGKKTVNMGDSSALLSPAQKEIKTNNFGAYIGPSMTATNTRTEDNRGLKCTNPFFIANGSNGVKSEEEMTFGAAFSSTGQGPRKIAPIFQTKSYLKQEEVKSAAAVFRIERNVRMRTYGQNAVEPQQDNDFKEEWTKARMSRSSLE